MKRTVRNVIGAVGATAVLLSLSACSDGQLAKDSPKFSAQQPPETTTTTEQAEETTSEQETPTATRTATVTAQPEHEGYEDVDINGAEKPTKFFSYPGSSDEYAIFQSPSGNIGCSLGPQLMCSTEEGSDYALMIERGLVDKIKPGNPGPYVEATKGSQGDKVKPQTLDYGESVMWNGVACTSRKSGMVCVDVQTLHGGKISRKGIETF